MADKCAQILEGLPDLWAERDALVKEGKSTASVDTKIARIIAQHNACERRPHSPIQEFDVRVSMLLGATAASLVDSPGPGMPASLSAFLDDWYCGTPPHPVGPPTQEIIDIISALLGSIATLPESSMTRNRVGEVAAHLNRLAVFGVEQNAKSKK